jgi:hypothetical protein
VDNGRGRSTRPNPGRSRTRRADVLHRRGRFAGKPFQPSLVRQSPGNSPRRASHPFSKRGLDFFVDQLESLPQEFDAIITHGELIANPKSKFNSLHHAIVELAGIGGAFPVVTTNYDNHLALAATSATTKISDT